MTLPQRPHTIRRKISAASLLCLAVLSEPVIGTGQIVFQASDLPSTTTDYWRAYVNNSGTDVAGRAGLPGGPRRWDFSGGQGTGDTVRRMDIVPPTDGNHGELLPTAEYAERLTSEGGGASWSYYRLNADVGRIYYGFYDPLANPIKPLTAFNAPTVDLPSRISYGLSWRRTVDFEDLMDAGFMEIRVAVHFTCQAEVDAYGTVVLPEIGEVPALRVNEVNTYELQDLTLGLPLPDQNFRNYYWLVRGIGKAVHIISEGQTSVPPANFSTAKTVLRVFEASSVTDKAGSSPVEDVRIAHGNGTFSLEWPAVPAAAAYRVEATEQLAPPAWAVVGETSTNEWVQTTSSGATHRFFRVFSLR